MRELGLADTHGILRQPWIKPLRTSAGLGWEQVYVSTQPEQPFHESFGGASSHMLILHIDGPVTVRRGHRGLTSSCTVPPGGMFLHPADTELDVELGGKLNTVHVYLADTMLQQAAGEGAGTNSGGRPVRLAEEFGRTDPLLEQLVLALDAVLRSPQPSARTYIDQLTLTLAAQLAHNHSTRTHPAIPAPAAGLTDRQFAAVRELMEARLDEPLPLADLAAAAGLSISQLARSFKTRTGLPPHRYLMRLRIEQAARLLRTGTMPIAEVAIRCGFSHQEHLTRALRASLGTTPAALRRS